MLLNRLIELTILIILYVIFYKGDSELMIGALTILILISINNLLERKKKIYAVVEFSKSHILSIWDNEYNAQKEVERIILERKKYDNYDEEDDPSVYWEEIYLNDPKDEFGNMKRRTFYTRLKEEIKDIKSLFIKIKNKHHD